MTQMSKTAHTPGPWSMKFEPPTPDYEYPYMKLDAGDTDENYFNLSGIIQEANARLISTAPDGLTLAHEVVREHENLDDRAPTEPECQHCNLGTGPHIRTCAYHQAKALIAKAEGRS